MKLCWHMKFRRIASEAGLYNYVRVAYGFSRWLEISPDLLVNQCKDSCGYAIPKAIVQMQQRVDSYVAYLRSRGLATRTVKCVCTQKNNYTHMFHRATLKVKLNSQSSTSQY